MTIQKESDHCALPLHSQFPGLIVVLQVSALSKRWDELRQQQAGCFGSSVTLRQIRPRLQGEAEGPFPLHSHIAGAVVVLQLSAFWRQCASSRQEHPGCKGTSVILIHNLPVSQGECVGTFELHSHIGGLFVVLQVSEFSKQSIDSKHEHGGWPT